MKRGSAAMKRGSARTRLACALGLVCLVLLAGCASPLSAEETPASRTTSAEVTPTETATATETARSGQSTSGPSVTTLPPGVTLDGLANASALLDAHARVLLETGFVAVGNGTSVINRNGVLVEVATFQENRVSESGDPYEVTQRTVAGPFQREVRAWSNGSVEIVRTRAAGETNHSTAEPRSTAELTGHDVLGPYLRGGNFTLNGTANGTDELRIVLVASEVGNATQLQRALPNDAEEVTSYQATVVIDAEGRIHELEATIGYVLSGREATQVLDYSIEHVGEIDIGRPDWVEEDRNGADGQGGDGVDGGGDDAASEESDGSDEGDVDREGGEDGSEGGDDGVE